MIVRKLILIKIDSLENMDFNCKKIQDCYHFKKLKQAT